MELQSIATVEATGYYTKKYYNSMDCSGPLNFIEGYATGLCLISKSAVTGSSPSPGLSVVLTGRSKDFVYTLYTHVHM
jgi:hypothetical protein